MKTRQKSKKTFKQVLSLFLAVLMLTGTMELGFGGLLSMFTMKASAESAIKVAVPETIYLKPSASSATEFQYYVNTVIDGSGNVTLTASKNEEQGKVYLYGANITGASVTLSSGTASIADKSVTLSKSGDLYSNTNVEGSATWSLTSGKGLSSSESKTVKWTFTYTQSGVSHTTYAYSTVYAPYYYSVGAMANGYLTRNIDYGSHYSSSATWFVGVHGCVSSYGTYAYAPNRAANLSGMTLDPMAGTISTPDDNNGKNWLNKTGVLTWRHQNEDNNYSSTGRPGKETSPFAELYVDSSRYGNLNEIPNLKYGFAVFDAESCQYGFWNVYDWTSKGAGETGNGEGGTHASGVEKTGDALLGGVAPPSTLSSSGAYQCGIRISGNTWTKALGTKNTDYNTVYSIRGTHMGARGALTKRSDGYGEGCACTLTQANLLVHGVDKRALRAKVQEIATAGYSADEWENVDEAYVQACLMLGQPDATEAQCSGALDALTATALSIGGSYPQYALTFYVPELIYLTPTTSTMDTFKYYVDRDTSGNLRTGENTTGNFTFNCPAAKKVKSVTCDNAQINNVAAGSSITSNSSGGSVSISIGSTGTSKLTTGINEATRYKTLTWTVVYTIEVNGVDIDFTAKSYTVCYAPHYTPVGSVYCFTHSGAKESDAVWWVDGLNNGGTEVNNGYYLNGTKKIYSMLGQVDVATSSSYWHHGSVVTSGTGSMALLSCPHSSNYSNSIGANLYVDLSRYNNLSQIPNVKTSCMLIYKKSGSSLSYAKVYQNSEEGTEIISGGSLSSEGYCFQNQKVNYGLSSGSNPVIFIKLKYSGSDPSYPTTTLTVNMSSADKSGLRELYIQTVNSGRQERWYTPESWAVYAAALKTAGEKLGKLTEVDSATDKDNLAAAVAQLEFKTGVFSYVDKSTSGKILATSMQDKFNYGLSKTATTAQDGYDGYNYDGFKVNMFNFESWADNSYATALAGSGHTDTDKIYIDNDNYSVRVTGGTDKVVDGKANNDIYTSYAGANTFRIPCVGGHTYHVHADLSAVSGSPQFYVFAYKSNGNGGVANAGTDNQWIFCSTGAAGTFDISKAAPSDTEWFEIRVGVSSVNSDVTIKGIQIYDETVTPVNTVSGKTVTFPDLCEPYVTVDFMYSPIKYNAIFSTGATGAKGTWSGTTSTDNKTVSNYTIDGELKAPGIVERAGYVFAGWKVTTAAGNWAADSVYGKANSTELTGAEGMYGAVTFTAQWTPIELNITYDLDGGTVSSANPTTYDVEHKTVTLNAPSKTGYTFTGWKVQERPYLVYDVSEYSHTGAGDFVKYSISGPFAENDVYVMECDVKGTGPLDNFFYGDGDYKQVARSHSESDIPASDRDVDRSKNTDGNNHILNDGCTTNGEYKHYKVTFTLSANGDGTKTKYIMFRSAANTEYSIKNIIVCKVDTATNQPTSFSGNSYTAQSNQADLHFTATWTANKNTVTINPGTDAKYDGNKAFVSPSGNANRTTGSNLTYSFTQGSNGGIDISGDYTVPSGSNEITTGIPVYVYLENGKTYKASWTSNNDITEFFVCQTPSASSSLPTSIGFNNGCYFSLGGKGSGSANAKKEVNFTLNDDWRKWENNTSSSGIATPTGWYHFRLDQDGAGGTSGTYSVTDFKVVDVSTGVQTKIMACTDSTVNIGNAEKTGYTFTGWTVSGTGSSLSNGVLTVGTAAETTLYAKWERTSATICALEEVQLIEDGDTTTITDVTPPQKPHGTVEITNSGKSIKFTPTDMTWCEPETFTVTFSKGDPRTITVYPQTNILYEETACTSVDTSGSYGWTRVGSAPSGDKGNSTSKVYGYSNAYENKDNYSAGYAYCSTVSSSDDGYAYYNFTFTGTGFDIVGMCDDQSGVMAVQVLGPNDYSDVGFINTYYSDGERYQEVVYHKYNLPYGTYNVSVAAFYDPIFDFTKYTVQQAAGYNTVVPENGSIIEVHGLFGQDCTRGTYYCVDSESYRAGNMDIVDFEPVTVGAKTTIIGDYNVTIDGVRIYNPGGLNGDLKETLRPQYTSDDELNPTYARLVDILNNESVTGKSVGTLYVEAGSTTDWATYKQVGSKSEVQLYTGTKQETQIISLQVSGCEKIHVSLKAVEIPEGTRLYAVVKGAGDDEYHEFEIISKTEQYYDVTDWVIANGRVFTIACVLKDGEGKIITNDKIKGILAICNFKYFGTTLQGASTESAVIFESTENALLSAKTMMTAMYKPKAEDMVFTVDFGDYGTTQVRVKKEYVKVEQVNGEWTATAKLSEKTLEELLENMGITDDYGIDGKGITLTAKRVGDEWQTERATVKVKKLNLFEKLVQKIVRFFTLVIERITRKFTKEV